MNFDSVVPDHSSCIFNDEKEDDLFKFLRAEYPLGLRRLKDNSLAAVLPLMFTTSIILGVDRWGYSNRFCFSDKEHALEVFNLLESEDDVPQGFLARR